MEKSVVDKIEVEVSVGELLDKLTILEIKQDRIKNEAKLKNIRKELAVLGAVKEKVIGRENAIDDLFQNLKSVNERLWDIEDQIRECERRKDFGPQFVHLARSVYLENDQRSHLKSQLNEILGSNLREEKSYSEYSFQLQ